MSRTHEWISWRLPDFELPDDSETVLICVNGVVGEGFLDAGQWHWASAVLSGTPSLWAPIPEGRALVKDMVTKLQETLQLVRSAQASLSVEDYGDALAGAERRLEELLAEIQEGGRGA